MRPIRGDLWHLENATFGERENIFIHTTYTHTHTLFNSNLLICLCRSCLCLLDTHRSWSHALALLSKKLTPHLNTNPNIHTPRPPVVPAIFFLVLLQNWNSLLQSLKRSRLTVNHGNHNLCHMRQWKNKSGCWAWVCQYDCNLMRW